MPLHYDIIIQNGRVIDPAQGSDGIKDLYIRDGLFVSSPPAEAGSPAELGTSAAASANVIAEKIIDAVGCIVAPGFIDAHNHVFYGGSGDLSTDADLICPPNCVTTVVDAGSTGISNFEAFYRDDIVPSITTIKALLHPCRNGVQLPPEEENENPDFFAPDKILRLFQAYPQVLRGLKIRMSRSTARNYGLAPFKAAQKIAAQIRDAGYHCGVYAHYSDLCGNVTMAQFMDSFQTRDIVFHFYHPDGDSIFNPDGSIMDCVLRARERGVLFDSSRGRVNFSITNILKASRLGFYPDIISTDLVRKTIYRKPNFSILNSMSLFLNIGMPLPDVIRAVTYNPAMAYGLLETAGTLIEGRPADVAIIKGIAMEKEYADCYGGKISGNQLLIPMATVKDGQTIFQQIFMA